MKTDTFVQQLVCQEDDDEGTMGTRSSIPHQIAVPGRPETEQDDEVQTTVTLLTTEQNDEQEEEEDNTATSTTLKQEEDDETASLSVGEEDGDNNVNEGNAGNGTYTWRGIARNVGIVAAVAGGSVATAGLALTVAGFGASGIMGGSIAACWQSSIGNVAAGSLFATLQSAGATGTIAACTSAGAATAAAGGSAAALSGRGNDTASHPRNEEGPRQTVPHQPPDDEENVVRRRVVGALSPRWIWYLFQKSNGTSASCSNGQKKG